MAILTKEEILKNSHISREEIIRDIQDTAKEIAEFDKKISRLQDEVDRRQKFIYKLQEILAYRRENNSDE